MKKEVDESIEENIDQVINRMKETIVEPWLFGHRLWIRDHENFDEEEWLKDRWRESEINIEADIEIEETGQRSKVDKKENRKIIKKLLSF